MSICEFKTKVLYEFQGDPVLQRVGEEEEEKKKEFFFIVIDVYVVWWLCCLKMNQSVFHSFP